MLAFRMLEAAHLVTSADYPSTILADSPLAYWRLQETSGTTMTDSGAHSLPGTYSTGVALGQTGLLNASNPSVSARGGTSGIAQVPANAILQPATQFSLECWINADTATISGNGLISEMFNGTADKAMFTLGFCNGWPGSVAGAQLFIGSFDGSAWHGAVSPSNIAASTRYHVVGTFDGTNFKLYMNGALITTTAGTYTTSGNPINIGYRWDSNGSVGYFGGRMQEVAIYGTALTATKVLNHYNAGA